LYLELGRKGAKSTLMAAIALFHLLREHEPGASVVCGATTGSQARIVFTIAQRMVRRSAWLRADGVQAFANAIVTGDGTMKPINAKTSTQDGLNPSLICLDESHAQTFALHDVLKSAQGARLNPLLLCPTTAGYDQLSVGYALRTTLTKVLRQVFDADHFLGAIYTIDPEDDWRDPRVWVKANPMLGITPTVDFVQRYCADAQQTPGLEAEFRVKTCSEWFNSASTWLSMTAWDRCADPTLTLDAFAGQPCWIGADLAQLDDLAAVALVFQKDDLLVAFVRCYLPELVVAERARRVPEYRLWVQAGLLTLTDGNMIDYSRIERDIRGWCQQFTVRAISFDQFGSVQIAGNLSNDGLPAWVEAKNAKSFTPPARELETRVKHGRFRHDGNACLKWQASNVVVSRRIDDSILPKKEGPESANKIDAIDALLQAIAAMLRAPMPVEKEYTLLIIGGPRHARAAGRHAMPIGEDVPPAWAAEWIAATIRLADEVCKLRAELGAARGERSSDADARVAQAIAELDLKQAFSCREIAALASTDAGLRRALDQALVDGSAEIGKLFARLHRRGLIDRDARRGSHGWRWRL
jgi:phage terminase large subunit-like protein